MVNSSFSTVFPRAYSSLGYSAVFRQQPEDFYVEETLGFSFSGEGEHACFFIEKTSQNTHWIAQQMANHYSLNDYDVGFCGRKDRHAVTRQWLSLYDPHRKVSHDNFPTIDGVVLLDSIRHHKKLRPGDHSFNRFVIRLRGVSDSNGVLLTLDQQEQLLRHANTVLAQGVPNYFGAQRFGRQGNNLTMAHAWFAADSPPPRRQKSMVLSAARSWIFNQVLAERVRQQCWRQALQGDIVQQGFPTGPLWGRGQMPSTDEAAALEKTIQAEFPLWCERLEHQGLQQERRPLVLLPINPHCQWQNNDFIVSFALPVGTFATVVLDELFTLTVLT